MKFVVTMSEEEIRKVLKDYVESRLNFEHSVIEECEFFDDGSAEFTVECNLTDEIIEEYKEEEEEEDKED